MRWDYDPEWRDLFDDGVHRDILIVPHATNVTPVAGSQPTVTSKVPQFEPDTIDPTTGEVTAEGHAIPGVYQPVEWVITNSDLIKEKFEYVSSICSTEKLSYGACEAAMVKFTIRNNKTYNEETQRWELDIPNLQKIEVIDDDGRTLLGEVSGSAIIEVYTYINGDSSSLMWLGMFSVEEDKVTGNGYEREIVAYDFMLTFRDMDIFNWYRSLFDGVPIDSDDWSKGIVPGKEGKDEWTIGEALHNLLDNLCYLSPSKPTVTNPKEYLMDMSAADYPGYGMPIVLDPDLEDTTVDQLVVPSETGSGNYERYGYMPILKLPFRKDEKIMKKGSLSCGKFLEDIAILAGRFGIIRADKYVPGDYVEPASGATVRYNRYEKCILTFRPIPAKDNVVSSENYFDNDDVEKGLLYDLYDTVEVKLIEIFDYDGNKFYKKGYAPSGLSKQEKDDYQKGEYTFGVLTIKENMFTSYLNSKDTDQALFIKMLNKGWTGTRNGVTYDGTPLLKACFENIIHRPYRPCQFTTTSDLCRQPGDRVHVQGIDKITGEPYEYYTYILVRRCNGIQKQMDKYTAKGEVYQGTYSDYRAGELNDSFRPKSFGYGKLGGNGNGGNGNTVIEGMTLEDLIEYNRNWGIRLLDDPTNVSAVYNSGNNTVALKWTDPPDIDDEKPYPIEWEGTTIVRKEGSAPRSRWDKDAIRVTYSKTRDAHASDAYVDDTVERGKTYYYGFFPYYTAVDDEDVPIRYYRPTTVLEVNTELLLTAPEITKLSVDGTDITVKYNISLPPSGSFTVCKLVAKKGKIPKSATDGDKIYDISASSTKKKVTGLDENSKYYFVIFVDDGQGSSASSDPKSAKTSDESAVDFSYTGEIQTFTAPRTGIYQLETWGAQGGDATDGTNTARGGYGAYSVGEVFLAQGDKLYVNVGGQNGYGGGGTPEPDIPDWAIPYLENISKFILDGNDYLAASADYGWMQGKWEGQYTHSYYNSSTDWTINSSRVSSLALLDIHIDGSDNSYSVTGNFVNKNDAFSNYGSSGYRAHLTYSNGTTHVSDTDGTIEQSPFTQTFSSLESALSYCQNHFKHCSVYVNNELWISAEAE